MADCNIGSLPQAPQLDDDSLLVAEQQGQAVKVTGAQFKEFGRKAVISQVQGFVDQAEAAAYRAVDAVSAVLGMTVEASTLESGQSATVTKTTQNGRVNLAFGLPRGAQGVPGPEGPEGRQGPKGEAGAGLDIAGRYDTTSDVPTPQEGKSYYIGTQAPYDLCTYVNGEWVNNGPISGGGGGFLPEDVVTAEGGASVAFPADLGDGSHAIVFVDEEEPPLTAGDVAYADGTVQEALDGLKSSVSNGKSLIASAITDKGVATAQDATFAQMAENIGEISTRSDTADATATSFDILAGKTAYTAAGKVEGVIPTLAAQTIVPGTADKTISNGQYLGGTQTVKGDANLTSSNIKKGVTLFGVAGALESTFKATLTVKADTGAVVTATHTDGTKVEALSTNGQVVLELPIEGTWKVTAVRGVAQYNTVTIQVTSQYNAELTAEVHIEYYGVVTDLSSARNFLAAAVAGAYALFCGGDGGSYGGVNNSNVGNKTVDAYDKYFTRTNPTSLRNGRGGLSGTSVGKYALLAGGRNILEDLNFSDVDVYDKELIRITTTDPLSEAKPFLGGTSIGNYALFGGGALAGTTHSTTVDVYDLSLTHSTATPLAVPSTPSAASNGSYAIFYGGSKATAYDKNLTRTLPVAGGQINGKGVRAGSYVIFYGYRSEEIFAYDMFLTKTIISGLDGVRSADSATTLNDFAVIYTIYGGDSRLGMDVFDPFLVRTTSSRTGYDHGQASVSIDNYALFAGGQKGTGTLLDTVHVYQYV